MAQQIARMEYVYMSMDLDVKEARASVVMGKGAHTIEGGTVSRQRFDKILKGVINMGGYWKKLKRDSAGQYYAESDYTTGILRIYKISRNVWGCCIGNGMTKGTFDSLRSAKKYYGIC